MAPVDQQRELVGENVRLGRAHFTGELFDMRLHHLLVAQRPRRSPPTSFSVAGPFVKKIRAGFILLQAGMAFGLIRDCIQIMDEVEAPLGRFHGIGLQPPRIGHDGLCHRAALAFSICAAYNCCVVG